MKASAKQLTPAMLIQNQRAAFSGFQDVAKKVVYLVVLVPCLFGADQLGHSNLGMSIVGLPVYSTTPDTTSE